MTKQDDIDRYLHDAALAEQTQGIATVHAAVDTEYPRGVIGFFTLSPMSLRVDENLEQLLATRDVPYSQLGGYLLGRMGVHHQHHGAGLGGALVAKAVEIARAQRARTGGVFLAVDPKTLKLATWYERLGFTMIDASRNRHRMILALM